MVNFYTLNIITTFISQNMITINVKSLFFLSFMADFCSLVNVVEARLLIVVLSWKHDEHLPNMWKIDITYFCLL